MTVILQSVPVDLGLGVTLEAPGLVGTADRQPGLLGGRSDGEPNATPALAAALDEQGFIQQHAVEVRAEEDPFATSGLRTGAGAPGMVLRVPDLGAHQPQVLMMVNEAGVVTWHPQQPDQADPTRVAFVVDRRVAQRPNVEDADHDASRGLVSLLGTKLLTVLVMPIVERAVGLVGAALISAYEAQHRPQGVRLMTPTGFRQAGRDPITDWSLLDGGRALLMLHGTASSSHGAFQGLSDEVFGRLHSAYQGRVFAFDHHTLSADLNDNVSELISHLPADRRLEVDVVTHSRGGLVARALASALASPRSPLDIRKIVYVSTPNGGTPLADPAHIRAYLDRMTTMLNLVPDGPWSVVTDTMSGLLTVVRAVLAGTVEQLPGLQVMSAGNPALDALPFLGASDATDAGEYAIDVEFEPDGPLLRLTRAVDTGIDWVFGNVPNDIVVPTDGAAAVPSRQFVLPANRRVSIGRSGTAWHCAMFSKPQTGAALTSWLADPLTVAPGP